MYYSIVYSLIAVLLFYGRLPPCYVLVPVLCSTEKTEYSRLGFTVLYRRDRWLTEKTENVPWYGVSAQIPKQAGVQIAPVPLAARPRPRTAPPDGKTRSVLWLWARTNCYGTAVE